MAESKNAAADQEFNDDGTENPDYVKPTDGGEGAADDSENKDGDDEGDDDDSDDDDDSFDDDAEPNVPVRNSAASHIIARKNKKIKKLKSNQNEGDGGNSDSDDDEEDGDDDDKGLKQGDVDDAVAKAVKPIKDQMISDADKGELKQLLSDEPDSKKYEKHIKAYMGHESYAGVPPAVIFHHLAFTAAQAIGAKKKEAADAEADGNKGGGNDIKPDTTKAVDGLPTAKEIENMSEEDFNNLEQDALQGKFVKKK